MHIEYHKWWSNHLNQDMELKVYGHSGRAFLVFPTQAGRFFDFENHGMIHSVEHLIAQGRVRLFAVDSIDGQSWDDAWKSPEEKAARHNDYDRYIIHEVVPFIHTHCQNQDRIVTTGASMGATHAVNFFFRHPDLFGGTVALSGVYNMYDFIDYKGGSHDFYYNSPLSYLPGMSDNWFLNKYRESDIIVSVGQGAWEEPMLTHTRKLGEVLREKNIPAWVDIWGTHVNHDWNWWLIQFPYFLEKIC